MTLLATILLGASLGLGSFAGVLYLASKAKVEVGQGRSVIPKTGQIVDVEI